MKEGYICRPLGGELGYSQGRDANYQLNDGGGINLGFYAILQNFANLKIWVLKNSQSWEFGNLKI